MVQTIAEFVFDVGLQAIGWAVLKGISFGRYQGFQPEDILIEGLVGFATVAGACYGIYHLLT